MTRLVLISLLLCMILLLGSNTLCIAAESSENSVSLPPPVIADDVFKDVPANIKDRLALHFTLGKFVGDFEKTTLGEINTLIGSGVIQHQGDTGDSTYWLCYTATSTSTPQRLWLIANGEMGGPEHRITEITFESLAKIKEAASCPTLPVNFIPILIDQKITLGMDSDEIIKLLGSPSKIHDNWLIYNHLGKVENDFDEVGWLLIRLDDNHHIDHMSAGKITSN